ncbi:uncharacterized protein KY384_003046 [Bacidia gigantensis]|uniref:uncharacterized protein n=1 Tax=Bacidia gigantensis TaxID=2732470 RepID=UPI001D0598BE|nr:uncharacterized protein KY384_003046 [Bacidia gigantensis]KAG8531417.1 hypothetical protein KY384_003046 [Bacidia gigantensis]
MDRDTVNPLPTANVASEPPRTPEAVLGALDAKRKQLDQAIEDFKEQKEREYQKYERQLRQQAQNDHDSEKGSKERLGHSGAHPLSTPEQQSRHRRQSSSDRRSARKGLSARQALDQAFRQSNDSVDIAKGDQYSREWEGVFTPEYLALIDGDGRQQPGSSQNTERPDRPPEQSTLKASSFENIHPPLLPSFITTPIEDQAVSSSAPTQSPVKTHHRSDSANSNISISSLRSSMKDPKMPKSPKRVLFSIADGVVSPSTSPAHSRKLSSGGDDTIETPGSVGSVLALGKRTGRDKKKKNRRKERGDSDRGRRSQDEVEDIGLGLNEERGFTNFGGGLTKSIATLQTKQTPVNGSIAAQASSSEDYEKIEKAEDDDLFAFDEDLTSSPSSRSAPEQVLTHDFSDDENDSHTKDPLTGTSPHAGSLPIEIKWPGRKESGG